MTIIIERDASGKIVRYEDEAARVAGRGGMGSRGAPLGPAAPATRDEIIAEHVRAVSEAREASKVEQRRHMAELAAEVAVVEARFADARRTARDLFERERKVIRQQADEQERLMEKLRDVKLKELQIERRCAMDPLDARASELARTQQSQLGEKIAALEGARNARLAEIAGGVSARRTSPGESLPPTQPPSSSEVTGA